LAALRSRVFARSRASRPGYPRLRGFHVDVCERFDAKSLSATDQGRARQHAAQCRRATAPASNAARFAAMTTDTRKRIVSRDARPPTARYAE
jgi:hypothetical protein